MKKIMIVEDDKDICRELKEMLDHAGYEGVVLSDFHNGCRQILKAKPDLVLLDINIPFQNGEMLLKELRESSDVPVIMVTSRETEADEVLSMSYGADDYIVKPYNPTILLLRIHAIFRRLKGATGQLNCGGMEIMPQKGDVKYHNGEKEMLLTKNEMMTELWNNEEYINDNALTVNISRLRGKLKEMGCDGMIETRKGQGYILREGDKE